MRFPDESTRPGEHRRSSTASGPGSLPIRTLALVLFVCAALIAVEGWREWATHDAKLHNAATDAAHLAHSFIQHAEDTFEMADAVLLGMVERLDADGTGPTNLERLNRFLEKRVANLPRL